MLGTVHILMIRHGFYRSLPHREGGGGTGTVTGRKEELRRQLRVVRRNPHLIAALFLHQTGLQPTGDDLHLAALGRLHRKQATLRRKYLAAQARELHRPVILPLSEAKGKDLQSATVAHNRSSERQRSEPLRTRHRRVCPDGQSRYNGR